MNNRYFSAKKALWTFFGVYFFIWGFLPGVFFNSIFPDTAQNLSWGNIFSWGTDRHPPLGDWVVTFFNVIFHNNEMSAYFAGALCLLAMLFFTYKTARLYLSEEIAVAATLVSTLSYYCVANYVMQYDQGTIMLPFWSATIYFFIKAYRDNKRRDWIFLSLASVLAMLAKYESGIIIFLECAYLAIFFKKKYLRNVLLATTLFFILLIPHIIWLVKTHFLLLQFPIQRGYQDAHVSFFEAHVWYAVSSLFGQPANLLLCFFLIAVCLKLKWLSLRHLNKNKSMMHPLVYFGVMPLLLVCVISCISGANIFAEWGSPFFLLTCVSVFYFFDIGVNKIKPIFYVTGLLQFFIAILYFAVNYFSTDISRMNYPGLVLAKAVEHYWKEDGYPIENPKFIGGAEYPSYYLAAYYPSRPALLVNNSLYYSPWIEQSAFLKSKGIIIYAGCDKTVRSALRDKFSILEHTCVCVPAANKFKKINVFYTVYIVQPHL